MIGFAEMTDRVCKNQENKTAQLYFLAKLRHRPTNVSVMQRNLAKFYGQLAFLTKLRDRQPIPQFCKEIDLCSLFADLCVLAAT